MEYLIFALLTLTAVHAYRDPTTVCTNAIYEVDFYDFDKMHLATGVVDHASKKMVISVPERNLLVAYNWQTLKGYQIDTYYVTCQEIEVTASIIPPLCLPANATPMKDMTLKIGGYFPSNRNDVVAYNVRHSDTQQFIVVFTNTTPAYPVYREVIGPEAHHMGNHLLFFNTRTTYVRTYLFDISPYPCFANL